MRIQIAVLLLAMMCSGCGHFFSQMQQKRYEHHVQASARSAYKCANCVPANCFSQRDFERGWKQGYFDVSMGGDTCPPTIAPQEYWAPRFQSLEGRQLVACWFEGYRLGAATAQRCGMNALNFVPLGPYCERQQCLDCPPSDSHELIVGQAPVKLAAKPSAVPLVQTTSPAADLPLPAADVKLPTADQPSTATFPAAVDLPQLSDRTPVGLSELAADVPRQSGNATAARVTIPEPVVKTAERPQPAKVSKEDDKQDDRPSAAASTESGSTVSAVESLSHLFPQLAKRSSKSSKTSSAKTESNDRGLSSYIKNAFPALAQTAPTEGIALTDSAPESGHTDQQAFFEANFPALSQYGARREVEGASYDEQLPATEMATPTKSE